MNRRVEKIRGNPERMFVTKDLAENLWNQREEHDQPGGLEKRQEGQAFSLRP
jgi:hypothetical protein